MHVDTGHNFAEVLDFRDRRVAELGVPLVVASVQESIDDGRVREETGPEGQPQPAPDRDAARRHRGARLRRRVRRRRGATRRRPAPRSACSRFRDEFGQWDPKNQRPELWNLYNGRHRKGEHIRVFPISNWTEMDVWQYIEREDIELPSIYYAHEREVFRRDGMLLAVTPFTSVLRAARRSTETIGPLPHRRRRDAAPVRSSPPAATAETSSSRSRRPASPSAARPAPTTSSPRPPWKTARRRATSDGAMPLRFATAGSSTTARARSSGACSSTPSRSSRTSSRRVERTSREQGVRLHEPRAADRRPARRARAGHHDRRRVPLLRDAAAQVHHRRHAGPRAVHAQHGHRRVDRGPRHDPRRRAQGRARAVAPPRVSSRRCCGVRHLVLCVNKMDLVDYDQERLRRDP